MAKDAWGRQPPTKKHPKTRICSTLHEARFPIKFVVGLRVDDWVDPDATEFVWESVLGQISGALGQQLRTRCRRAWILGQW